MYCIVDNLIPDLAQLKILRNTCKHLQAHVPLAYVALIRLYKLQSKVWDLLHEMAYTIAPTLRFRTTWQRRHFEFAVELGRHYNVVLWTATSKFEALRIVDSPSKAPNVCFELVITPTATNEYEYMSHMSKTGPPSLEGTEFGADKLEAILNKYKRTLSEQLLNIKDEVQDDEDFYDYNSSDEDNYDISWDHGQFDQLDESSQETAKIVEDNEVIIIQDEDNEVIIIQDDDNEVIIIRE